MTTPTRYWLSIGDGKSYGPYTVAELQRYRGEGRVGFDAQLCPEGSAEWVPARTVLEFGAPPTSPPPTPPPPAFSPSTYSPSTYSPSTYSPSSTPYIAAGAQVHPNAKSKVAAGILGILLGALGIHNFYLGYTGKGIAQLLITLLSCGYLAVISWIWGLIEGILILTGSIAVDGNGVPMRD